MEQRLTENDPQTREAAYLILKASLKEHFNKL